MKKKGNNLDLKEALGFSIELSKKAGALLLRYQKGNSRLRINQKAGQGIYSEADILSEELIIRSITKNYPQCNILAEESAYQQKIKDFHRIKETSNDSYQHH